MICASASASLVFSVNFELARRGGQADLDGVGVAGQHLRPLAPGRAVALVDDDVAEVVLGVVRGQEVGRAVVGVHVEGLVGGDVDAGVLGVVGAVRLRIDLGGVGAEDVLERAQALAAQLVAVADEQGAAQLAGVGDALEQVDGDEGLARAGGQREQGALGLAGLLAPGDLLQHGADGGVLVVAARGFAAGVAREQRLGRGSVQGEAHRLLVARAQVGGRGELGQRGAQVMPVNGRTRRTGGRWWRRRRGRSAACRRRRAWPAPGRGRAAGARPWPR